MKFSKENKAGRISTALVLTASLLLTAGNLGGCGSEKLTQKTDEIHVEASAKPYQVDPLTLFRDLPDKATAADFTVEGDYDTLVPGNYPITVTYKKQTFDFMICVRDTVAPVFEDPGQVFMTGDAEAFFEDLMIDALQYASDVTELTVEAGDFIRISDYESQSGEGETVCEDTQEESPDQAGDDSAALTVPDSGNEDNDPPQDVQTSDLPTVSGMYTYELIYTDLGGNSVTGSFDIALDLDAPVLVDGDGRAAVPEDVTIETEDLTTAPEYDLSAYRWIDNEKVEDSSDRIECIDEEKHIWQVTTTASDPNGNTAEASYKITLTEPAPAPEENEPGNGSGSGGSSGGGSSSGSGGSSGGENSSGQAGFLTSYAEEVLVLVNQERAAAGLCPLTMNYTLVECSNIRAQEIELYFSHTRPDGRDCFSAFNVDYWYAGENIADGFTSPERVMNGWMNSAGHRANILNENFTEIAISCYYDPNGAYKYYWVQNFIG